MTRALGLIEVVGLTGAIEGADAALKAANVHLIGIAKVGSGIMTIQLMGDVGAITAAVDAGSQAAKRICKLRASHVIPRMDDSLASMLKCSITEGESGEQTVQQSGYEKQKEQGKVQNETEEIVPSVDNRNEVNKLQIEEQKNTDAIIKQDITSDEQVINKTEDININNKIGTIEDTKEAETITKVDKEEETNDIQGKEDKITTDKQLQERNIQDVYVTDSYIDIEDKKNTIEHFNRMSNTALKELIRETGIEVSKEKLKTMKKQDLIQLILEHR